MLSIERITDQIVELLHVDYKSDDPKYSECAVMMGKLFRHWLRDNIGRIMWHELALSEAEEALRRTPEMSAERKP